MRLVSGILYFLMLWLWAALACASDAPGVVLTPADVQIDTGWGGRLTLTLPLSGPAPHAIGFARDPDRVQIRFPDGLIAAPGDLPERVSLKAQARGTVVSVTLNRPMRLERAELLSGAEPALRLRLRPTDPEAFAEAARLWQARHGAPLPAVALTRSGLRVALDPGHGGHDPGAQHEGIREADLVLTMARRLQSDLETRGIAVTLTRENDSFVSLSERIARANRAGADLLISLHADALTSGHATGASVHSLPEKAGEAGNQFLLDRLGQEALGSASAQDQVSDAARRLLMDLARDDSRSQSAALAQSLVAKMQSAGVALYKTPVKHSNFVVLRAADMPSVLVELGFLSEARDRARLTDPAWRARMSQALSDGIATWAGPRLK